MFDLLNLINISTTFIVIFAIIVAVGLYTKNCLKILDKISPLFIVENMLFLILLFLAVVLTGIALFSTYSEYIERKQMGNATISILGYDDNPSVCCTYGNFKCSTYDKNRVKRCEVLLHLKKTTYINHSQCGTCYDPVITFQRNYSKINFIENASVKTSCGMDKYDCVFDFYDIHKNVKRLYNGPNFGNVILSCTFFGIFLLMFIIDCTDIIRREKEYDAKYK